MKMPRISLLQWQKRYGTGKSLRIPTLAKYRWPNGFICPKCGHDSFYYIASRKVYQCCRCRNQVSVTAGTLFHSTNLPLVKWFWAIYLMASDKGGISALRLSILFLINMFRYLNVLFCNHLYRNSIFRNIFIKSEICAEVNPNLSKLPSGGGISQEHLLLTTTRWFGYNFSNILPSFYVQETYITMDCFSELWRKK